MYQYTLDVGDSSGDGHGRSDRITFNCSHSDKEIDKAYWQAVKKCKITLTDSRDEKDVRILGDYEESSITLEQMQQLIDIGVNLENMTNIELNDWQEDSKEWSYTIYSDGVAELFLEMVRTQLPEFKYDFVKLNILPYNMGYGCFSE